MSAKSVITPMLLIFHVVLHCLQAVLTSGGSGAALLCDMAVITDGLNTTRNSIGKSTLSSFALEIGSHNTNPLSKTGKLLRLFDA